jgi:uncharacterized protein
MLQRIPLRSIGRPSGALLAAGLACGLLAAGCGGDRAPGPLAMDPQETERWEIALVEWRIEKNEDFMAPGLSPLPAELLGDFEGLDYYFPEPDFRYRLPLEAVAAADTVQLALRKGQTATYLVRGQVRFKHGKHNCTLTVFGPVQGGGALWLPFYDPTNGQSTYPGGRYLDLELAADGTVEVDFNKAYNPLCAYDPERWDCVLPTAANTLPVPVAAGEKLLFGAQP